MRRPRTDDALVQTSFVELESILRWLEEREGGTARPTTVLIGGWAVYALNPYFGSYDIDLVTNAKTRKSLMMHLREERGYDRVADDHLPFRGVRLAVPDGGEVKIDFATFDAKDPFEGTGEQLDYEEYRQRVQVMDVEGVRVAMPDRSTLLLSKLKAAWDRQVRLEEGRASNAMWERGKLVKDRADILSLVDPAMGGDEMDINYLGRSFDRFPFLVPVLDRAGDDLDGIEKYGIIGREDARRAVDTVIALTRG